jgi:hypothetical protein
MSPSGLRTPVTPDETLARFILQSSHIRKGDQTVRPEAFVPHPYNDLSVTRHINLTQADILAVGEEIAHTTGKSLYGRADNQAISFLDQELQVSPDPDQRNPNHAIVVGWPEEKSKQKIIAMEIAASSSFIPA